MQQTDAAGELNAQINHEVSSKLSLSPRQILALDPPIDLNCFAGISRGEPHVTEVKEVLRAGFPALRDRLQDA